MIDPKLLAQVPHRNPTAYRDMIGTLALYYGQGLIPATIALTGRVPARYPVDPEGDPEDLLEAIQAQHASLSDALGIAPPPDLSTYDLAKPEDWASWTFLISQDLVRLRAAAGVN